MIKYFKIKNPRRRYLAGSCYEQATDQLNKNNKDNLLMLFVPK